MYLSEEKRAEIREGFFKPGILYRFKVAVN